MSEPEIYSSNNIRLSLAEWCGALLVTALFILVMPYFWKSAEKISSEDFKRVSFSLNNDYWLFDRYAKEACQEDQIPMLGDSVIWGHFVHSNETVTAHMNEIEKKNRFVNLGLNGAHPVALAGLIDYYAKPIENRKVIVHFNMLWMASKKQDLTFKKKLEFSHQDLVPQFFPNLGCYRRNADEKLGVMAARVAPFLSWKDHLKMAYFEVNTPYQWSIKNPHKNPLNQVNFELLGPDASHGSEPDTKPWHEKNIFFTPSWISLEKSFQWDSFKRCLDTLQSRNNEVFVLVGPLNIHAMKEDRREKFMQLKSETTDYFKSKNIQFMDIDFLPTDLYGDTSHPLNKGYELMAQRVMNDSGFKSFIEDTSGK